MSHQNRLLIEVRGKSKSSSQELSCSFLLAHQLTDTVKNQFLMELYWFCVYRCRRRRIWFSGVMWFTHDDLIPLLICIFGSLAVAAGAGSHSACECLVRASAGVLLWKQGFLTLPMLRLPSSRMQIFLKNIQTLSCWYSLDSSRWVLSNEYPFVRVSIIIRFFASFF